MSDGVSISLGCSGFGSHTSVGSTAWWVGTGHSPCAAWLTLLCSGATSCILLVGFDKNSILRARKGSDRPRFPQLAWRMWETGSLPTVDYVFVLPVDTPNFEDYFRIYKELGMTEEERANLAKENVI